MVKVKGQEAVVTQSEIDCATEIVRNSLATTQTSINPNTNLVESGPVLDPMGTVPVVTDNDPLGIGTTPTTEPTVTEETPAGESVPESISTPATVAKPKKVRKAKAKPEAATTETKETEMVAAKTPVKKPATKAAVKPAKAAPVKTKPAAPAPVAKAEKPEFRSKPQIRILLCLLKATKPLPRKEIAIKAPVDLSFLTEYLGSDNMEIRTKNDAKLKSLQTWGYVKATVSKDETDVTVYELTANGRKMAEKLKGS